MIPPERILRPEEVHSSHKVYDNGYLVSDPRCVQCDVGVCDSNYRELTVPCLGKQASIFEYFKAAVSRSATNGD